MTKVFINETLNENVIILPTEQGAIVTITASGAPGVTDHAALSNLTYATAGHTGFEPSLPSMVGASLKFLQVNLTENAKQWTTVTMTPAGADTQVQFNDGGSFGANANFTFLTATERFGVGLTTPLATGHFKRPSGYAEVRVEGVAAGSGALVTVQNDLGAGWYLAAFGSTNAGSFFFGLPNAGGCIASINAGVETWMGIGVTTAIPFIIGTNNVERERFLPAGGTNRNLTEYNYLAASATADAVGDWRYSNQAGSLNFDYCSVLNAAKGGGTWNTMLGLAANVVTYKAGQVWKPSADSTGALNFTKANGTTSILNIDSTNGRVGIGTTTPDTLLQIKNNNFISAKDYAGTSYVNMFKVNVGDTIEVGATLNISGYIEAPLNGGALTFFDMPVSAAAAIGTEESLTGRLGSTNIMKWYCESDGAGGIQRTKVINYGDYSMLASKYLYQDASPTADTANDIRTYDPSGVYSVQKCTVGNATKGSGTWTDLMNSDDYEFMLSQSFLN